MRNRILLLVALSVLFAGACAAQRWEFGGIGGFGLATGLKVENKAGASADIGFKNNGVIGVWGGNETYRRLSGEVRYLYRFGAAKLDTGSAKAELAARQHLITYSALWHFKDYGEKVRPFVAFGAGLRIAQGTGQPRAVQPGSSFAYLTPTTDYVAVVDTGVGVKWKISPHWQFRAEFRDYWGPAPKDVLTPAPGNTMKGIFHDLMPMVGISGTW